MAEAVLDIKQWGNNLGVRLPAAVAREARLHVDQRVRVSVEGDHVVITQRIKVGLKVWTTKVTGTVERTERRREGLNVKRSFDDKAWADLIVLKKDGAVGEETTVTLDEWTHVERA